MNKIAKLLSFLMLLNVSSFAQKLSLTDLLGLCNKSNWEEVNSSLLKKNWTFYDSEKGNEEQYHHISWTFGKDNYSDKAPAWFHLYTYEGFPNKLSYILTNKDIYLQIQNSLPSAGFKLIGSEIEDSYITSTYQNSSYSLKLATEKRKNEDWEERSTTIYRITIIKKAGAFDPNNGPKTDTYEYGAKKADYVLKEGQLHGALTVFHENGNIKKTGAYTFGKENGVFKEFDEDGNISLEYIMSNGVLNGAFKAYHSNGKLSQTGFYLKGNRHGNFIEYDEDGNKTEEYVMVNDKQEGIFKKYENGKLTEQGTIKDDNYTGLLTKYYYDNQSGKLEAKEIREYLNGIKNGISKLIYIDEKNVERTLSYCNYSSGLKNGTFQEISGDSLILGFYENDLLKDSYIVYRDLSKFLIGGVIKTDTAKLILVTRGHYSEGLQTGYWTEYDLSGGLISEGFFKSGQKDGVWKYYYATFVDSTGATEPYSGKLYLEENYINGNLSGKSTRFSTINSVSIPCPANSNLSTQEEQCVQYVYEQGLEISHYKDGVLDGHYEYRDSSGKLLLSGEFCNDFKCGEWLECADVRPKTENKPYLFSFGKYESGLKTGKWETYYQKEVPIASVNYQNGILQGECVVWTKNQKPAKLMQVNKGNLIELIVFDTIVNKPCTKYEIHDHQIGLRKLNCRKTEYYDSGLTQQEYIVQYSKPFKPAEFERIFQSGLKKSSFEEFFTIKSGDYLVQDTLRMPLIEGSYEGEIKVGSWNFYYYEQKLRRELTYNNGEILDEKYFDLQGLPFSGKFTYVDKTQHLIEVRTVKRGLLEGKTKIIDTNNNKLIKKVIYKQGKIKT